MPSSGPTSGPPDPHLTAAWLAAIIDSSADAIISKDLRGIITSWNQAAEKIFGYTAAEMVGTPLLRLIPGDRQGEETLILDQVGRGEKVETFETRRLTKAGHLIDIAVTASPIRDATGRVVGVSKIARDITAMKSREREIARLSRLYAALSQVNQAIVMSPTQDQLLRKVCEVLVGFGGFRLAWIGWHDPVTRQLVPVAVWGDENGYVQGIRVYADERPEGRGPSGQAFRSGRPCITNNLDGDPLSLPWRTEMSRRGLHASAALPVRCRNEVCAVLNVYSEEPGFFQDKEIALLVEAAGDISFGLDNFRRNEEREAAQRQVQQEHEFSEAMLNSLPGVLYLYDQSGRFLRWNRNFETVTGYTAAEIAKMHPLDFFGGTDKALVAARIQGVFTRKVSAVEAGLVSKDGRVTPYYFTGVATRFADRDCLVGVGIDISARVQAEAALREARDGLEHKVAERTAELEAARARAEAADQIKSAFLATMSHELRTPLNSIIGFTGILLQGLAGPLNAEQTKQLGMVRGSARHLLELINDVLDISKIEAGQLEVHAEPFDLPEAIARVTAMMQAQAEKKGLTLVTTVAPGLGEMVSDRRRVEQVLLNLINNAIKFTERGGVTLTVERLEDFQPVYGTAPAPAVRFRVADTGIGIKPEHLPKLFQPFRQIDTGLTRTHEDTGLGLVICRRLCVLMGGTISVASEWNQGSIFTATLPLRKPTALP